MALIASLAALGGAAIFFLACAATGHRMLQAARLTFQNALEHLLCCAAVGVIAYQAALAILEFVVHPRFAVGLSLGGLLLIAPFGIRPVCSIVASLAVRIRAGSRREHLLAAATGLVVLFTGLGAVAPLTGSDALQYHFTSQSLILRDAFVPHLSLVQTFFTGQGHLLILTGLALHSEQLSLALIFLGGLLAAAALACLARQWASREWAWLASLSLLLTPVVFWQASASGAPDIWMAFFVTAGVLVVARAGRENVLAHAALAGILAGALAGAKYTGCFFAFALLLAFLSEVRSLPRFGMRLALFFSAALATGIWPYARNALWTRDPVFPLLLNSFAPARMNSFTLALVLADTGANGSRSTVHGLLFPLFAAIDQAHAGFWQFFGPLPLGFALLILLAWHNTPLWRVATIVWVGSAVLVFASSGMLRFLLPVFPIALAASLAGAARLQRSDWPFARILSRASIAALLILCAAGALFYGRSAAAAAIGWTSREDYLWQRSPEYARVSFINQVLAEHGNEGNALVFLRHLYYLRVPFVSGNPEHNWEIDPARYSSVQAWDAFLRANNIRWVVRAPEYPQAIAAPLQQLEREGRLVPVASADVSDIEGMRLFGMRKTTAATILRVNP